MNPFEYICSLLIIEGTEYAHWPSANVLRGIKITDQVFYPEISPFFLIIKFTSGDSIGL